MKYLHSFVMIAILYWADVLFALPKEFQLAQNSFEQQRNFSNSNIKDYAEDGYVEDYSEDDPAPAPAAPPLNVKKEKLLYTKEIFIKQGRIKGIIRNFHPQTGLKDVDQYLGIPYAEAPTGSRRFMPPGASEPWQGLKIARHLPPVCPQNLPNLAKAKQLLSQGRYDQLARVLPYLKNESEDCLYLNVYVPSEGILYHSAFHHLNQEQQQYRPFHHQRQQQQQQQYPENKHKFPVIVYIHGESFEWNSGNPYDGSVLASYGQVIVVTLNYRLGVLGFMKPGTGEHTVSNFGLLDQIAALHWIKENIEFFGGDKNSVTLMGHSTGAVCVNFLMVSPVAPGLFHRAILMSGSAMSDWATTNHSEQITMQISEGVGCSFDDDFLSCARKKSYKDLMKVPTSYPQFATPLGPIVDGHVIPNQPYKVMSKYTELFRRYDLLFGVTEIESYHLLSPLALDKGLPEDERDKLLELYMQNRFKIRPDLAVAATLKKYQDVYSNPVRATNYEHRDALLEILSDARTVGPLVQTGLFHAEVNPRNYMYVFGHNSAGGPFATVPYSIPGEELAFIFGAPLAPAGPFHTRYTPQEKLLSEAVMLYWTNFARTGNPKAPWRESFINMHAIEWKRYDIHWPEFNKKTQSYLNIGIPPASELKYRNMYMNFWNKELPDELNEIGTIPPSLFRPYVPPGTEMTSADDIVTGKMNFYPPKGSNREVVPIWTQGHLNRKLVDRTTENSLRTLKLLTQNIKDDMLNAPPTFDGVVKESSDEVNSVNSENIDETKDKIVRSEALVPLLIGLIITVLILNAAIYSAYLIQKRKKPQNGQKRKFGIISYDGTTDDELKRSKHNDGDDSFILDICRKSSTIYDPIKPNGFKITNLSRQLSTSTVDAHTKVTDWITNDLSKTTDSKNSSSTFSSKCKSILKKPQKVSVAIDATPQNRSDSVLRQEPIEITKQKSIDGPRIICQEIDLGPDGDSDTSSCCPEIQTIRIDHKHSHSDPVEMYYTVHKNDEKTTSFVNEDINVTSRDSNSPFKLPLSPEEQLQNLKRRNFPKVLPNYPSDGGGIYESSSTSNSFSNNKSKRNSLPPNQFNRGIPPLPPPRTVSTLGRKSSFRRSNTIICSPLQLATEVDESEEDEPKITQNTLIVGPIVPKNKQESVYSTVKRNPPQIPTDKPILSSFQSHSVDGNNCVNAVDDGDYEEYQMNGVPGTTAMGNNAGKAVSVSRNSKVSRIPQLQSKRGNSIYSGLRSTSLSSSTASASSSGSTGTIRTSEVKQ